MSSDLAEYSLVDEESEMTEPVGPSPEDAFDNLAYQLSHFVPVNKWFSSAEDRDVIVQVFRIYRDAFGSRPAFPTGFLIQDFDALRVRAVFTRTNFLYTDAESKREFPTPDGGIEEQFEEVWTIPPDNEGFVRSANRSIWRSTNEGTFLLLITPYTIGVYEGKSPAYAARYSIMGWCSPWTNGCCSLWTTCSWTF